jgi:hypothetical protein
MLLVADRDEDLRLDAGVACCGRKTPAQVMVLVRRGLCMTGLREAGSQSLSCPPGSTTMLRRHREKPQRLL